MDAPDSENQYGIGVNAVTYEHYEELCLALTVLLDEEQTKPDLNLIKALGSA